MIEDLLDIQVFTKMNQILREKNVTLKQEITDTNYQLDLAKEKINLQRKYIRDITELNEEKKSDKEQEIADCENEVYDLQQHSNEATQFVTDNQTAVEASLKELNDKKQALLNYKHQFEQQVKTTVNDAKFYEDNSECPTCEQEIGQELRDKKLGEAKAKAKKVQDALSEVQTEMNTVVTNLNEVQETSNQIREKQSEIHSNNITIGRLQDQIKALRTDIENLTGSTGDLGEANTELQTLIDERDDIAERKLQYIDEKSYNDAAGEMLKDSGIKTKIVKEYLPVMNNLVNKYLNTLDFFVSFDLDENFNESIKSRYRDTFNYSSFSEGEKQRIDLALLFTWRQIARMKNSASTNLLILDETFDSSLDHDGIDNLMKILGTLEDGTNVFVISHKGDLLDGKFRSKIEFVKERNFSKVA